MSFYASAKRCTDMVVSAGCLVLCSPLLGLLLLLVKIDSRGPIFYGHERLGRHGRPFKVWKIRTMVAGGDRKGPPLTAAGDSRITRVGRVLRRTKLDELPQLWNVLAGDMSLVGPRPEVKRYASLFPRQYERLLTIRPGITDWATLAFRHEEEILARAEDPEREYVAQVLPAKLKLNLEYLRKQSMSEDLKILGRTLVEVLFR